MDTRETTYRFGITLWSDTDLAALMRLVLQMPEKTIPVVIAHEAKNPVDREAIAILCDIPKWLVPSKSVSLGAEHGLPEYRQLLGYVPRSCRDKGALAFCLNKYGPVFGKLSIIRTELNRLEFVASFSTTTNVKLLAA